MRLIKRKWLKRVLASILILCLACAAAFIGINGYVIFKEKDRILSPDAAAQLQDVDCILVLGCGIEADGTPSEMLTDRLLTGIQLYDAGASPKLLMSGDHGRAEHDEVNAMKKFALERNVPSTDIFMDHAGFSTYESMYRARDIFEAKKVIIVTQQYHLSRALYIAEQLGLDAYGVAADLRTYDGQVVRDAREVLARDKDFFNVMLQPKPTCLGDAIPISGDGDLTNDKELS
jgi:SanA protein